MSAAHIGVRLLPSLMLLLWAVATWLEPSATWVATLFMVLLAVSLAASSVEVHEWRKWRRRR